MGERIINFVRENPGLTAKQIRAKLGIAGLRKKDVNQTLYRAKSQGTLQTTQSDSAAPTWGPVAELV